MYTIKESYAPALITIDNLDPEAGTQLYGLLNVRSAEGSRVATMPDGHPHAYDVITAHEMGHAQISASGLEDKLTPYCQEALSDVKAGVYAGANGLPHDVYEGEIGPTGPGSWASGGNPAEYGALVFDVLSAFQSA